MSRRKMLKLTSLACGSGLSSSLISNIIPNDSLKTRIIPADGHEIPVVGMGTWIQFDVGDSQSGRENVLGVLKNARKFGGKVIDTSPMYGTAERVIGELTQKTGQPDHYFYATKVWTRGQEAGIEQMQRSMRRMGRDRIDLMQIHNLIDWKTHLKTLRSWKEEGKIRYIGITHYRNSAHDQLADIIETEPVDFVQCNYSIRVPHAEQRLLKVAQDNGVAVIINRPFEGGAVFNFVRGKELPAWATDFEANNWPQFLLKFILSHPAVTCVIPGTSNPVHEIEDVKAGYGALPDSTMRQRMSDFISSL